jgi:hypothetical protein
VLLGGVQLGSLLSSSSSMALTGNVLVRFQLLPTMKL